MHIQGYGSPAVEAATAFDFGFQFAAVRVLADLHGWNAPKKVAPTNPKGDGPATVRHELDLTKLADEQLDALEQILAVAGGETVAEPTLPEDLHELFRDAERAAIHGC